MSRFHTTYGALQIVSIQMPSPDAFFMKPVLARFEHPYKAAFISETNGTRKRHDRGFTTTLAMMRWHYLKNNFLCPMLDVWDHRYVYCWKSTHNNLRCDEIRKNKANKAKCAIHHVKTSVRSYYVYETTWHPHRTTLRKVWWQMPSMRFLCQTQE